jgi:hypothetical protein
MGARCPNTARYRRTEPPLRVNEPKSRSLTHKLRVELLKFLVGRSAFKVILTTVRTSPSVVVALHLY